MENNKNASKTSYFAAANSYNGFVSYFKEVFPSEKFTRIYVLKGGPGTGKSSLMKRVSTVLEEKAEEIEEIYCSSDPNSLDGVIASKADQKIAIIDGTAPHERDAVMPGVVDEIINLGENWQKEFLVAQRKDITEIIDEKAKAYKTAYNYLAIAGKNHEYTASVYVDNFDKIKAKYVAEKYLCNKKPTEDTKRLTRLITSFGKSGLYKLPLKSSNEIEKITIGGKQFSASLFLNILLNLLDGYEKNICIYRNALDKQMIDAIRLDKRMFIFTDKKDAEINTDEFCKVSMLDKEKIKSAEYMREIAQEEAVRWFKVASDLHFRLEEIYSQAMDFQKNNVVFDKITAEINNIF